MAALLGPRDEQLRLVEAAFDASIHVRGNEITVDGPEAAKAAKALEELVLVLERGQSLDNTLIRRAIEMVADNERPSEVLTDRVVTTARGKVVRPKTAGQMHYIDAIRDHMVTFGIGPAGTGKSWLAVACAVKALQDKKVERILLTRPAVEAGERLGFLPGDLLSKVDPYLRPLYDALQDMIGAEGLASLTEKGAIEVAPLAFMRGRTLNDSFIILDEAQNTTVEQMKMFLTRIGFGSTVVITGDITQVDLPRGQLSGLRQVIEVLRDVDGISFTFFSARDVVRHPLVQRIVSAYDTHEQLDGTDHNTS
jgi:phosphate starvation-inducible PhoH-like protein